MDEIKGFVGGWGITIIVINSNKDKIWECAMIHHTVSNFYAGNILYNDTSNDKKGKYDMVQHEVIDICSRIIQMYHLKEVYLFDILVNIYILGER